MLTNGSVNYLKPLVFREDAERLACMHPLGGIYWADEIPNFKELTRIPERDRIGIFHLFRIRFLIWNGDELSDDDKIFLEEAMRQIPDYPMFRRFELSDEDRVAQEEVERQAVGFWESMLEEAEEVTVEDNDGIPNVSFTIKNQETKKTPARKNKSWWERIF